LLKFLKDSGNSSYKSSNI